jgi:hypothetical protein
MPGLGGRSLAAAPAGSRAHDSPSPPHPDLFFPIFLIGAESLESGQRAGVAKRSHATPQALSQGAEVMDKIFA